MEVKFIKKHDFETKDKKKYYIITTLLRDKELATSFVDKKTYDWFESSECGDLIPSDFIDFDFYESQGSLKAKVSIKVD